MRRFIEEALRCYQTNGICIVNDPKDNNLAIETMDGNVFIQINKDMKLDDVLELCSIDVDTAAVEMGELIAKKMCNLINDGVSSMITKLDVNHVSTEFIECLIYEQRDMMLDYITDGLMYPETIKKG